MARIFESGVYTAVKRTDPLLLGDMPEPAHGRQREQEVKK